MSELLRLSGKNFCCLKEFDLPLSNQGLTLITGNNKDTTAASDNGSGKSTIPKAITWCLYGDTIDGDNHADVIRWDQNETEVEIVLFCDNCMWTIRRSRTKRSPKLELYCRDVDSIDKIEYSGEPKEIQKKIIDLIGLDFRGFCNTVLYGQGDNERFFSSNDTARKEMLHRVLRTDKYRDAENSIRKHVNKTMKPQIIDFESQMNVIEGKLGECDIKSLQNDCDDWEEVRNKQRLSEVDKMNCALAEAKKIPNEIKKRTANLKAQIEKQKNDIEKNKSKVSLPELEDFYDNALSEYNKIKNEISILSVKLEQQNEKLDELKGDKCPICTSPLDVGTAGEYIYAVTSKRDKNCRNIEKMNDKLEKASKKLSKARKQKDKAIIQIHENSNRETELARLNGELERIESEGKAKCEKYTNSVKVVMANIERIDNEKNPYFDILAKTEKRIEDLESEKKKLGKKIEKLRNDIVHHEFWITGFGNKGLPSLLLDSTMPFLTARANEHLGILSDSDITLSFSTQKAMKKKGEYRDVLDLDWVIEGIPGVTPSGGQRRKLEVATDLALMDLVSTREGSLNLLIMDELLDGLDREGKMRVMKLLRNLRDKRSSVFVVTHEPDIADDFEHNILVTKKNGASTVEIK